MLKINIYLKLALIFICTIGGIILIITQGFWYGFWFVLIGVGLLLSYILLGTIMSASEMIQKMDFDGAQQRLKMTLNPKWLYVTNRAMYYILQGTIDSNKGDNKSAEIYFNQALELDLPTDNEKGMVLLQLANIQATKGNMTGAKNYFAQLKKLNVTESKLKDQIAFMEKAIKNNEAQMKAARSMGKTGMRMVRGGGGGKRRRPKMR